MLNDHWCSRRRHGGPAWPRGAASCRLALQIHRRRLVLATAVFLFLTTSVLLFIPGTIRGTLAQSLSGVFGLSHFLTQSTPCISSFSSDPDARLNPGYERLLVAGGVEFQCPPDDAIGSSKDSHMAFFLDGGGKIAQLQAELAQEGVLPRPGSMRLQHYSHYEDMTRFEWERYVLTIADPLQLACGQSIFEVGVGSGALVAVLHRYFDVKAAGTDLSLPLVRLARRALPGTFCAIDAGANTSFVPNDAFDRVISHAVFYYLHGLALARSVFGEMARIAKPGGMVGVMSINNVAADADGLYSKATNGQAGFRREVFVQWAKDFGLCTPRFEGQPLKYHNFNGRYSVFARKRPC